ncbi:MAG: hypothetical protein LBI86_09730 [Treponema sp.]|jgi:hypothetical protein|nr:hypothetical protein [Treponema sp.]
MVSAVFALAQEWGPSAVTAMLVVVVVHLSKSIARNGERDAKIYERLQAQINGMAQALRKEIAGQIQTLREDLARRLDEHERRLSLIERDYTQNVDFHRELGGWRTELNRISDLIVKNFMDFTTKIIELWKGKGHET